MTSLYNRDHFSQLQFLSDIKSHIVSISRIKKKLKLWKDYPKTTGILSLKFDTFVRHSSLLVSSWATYALLMTHSSFLCWNDSQKLGRERRWKMSSIHLPKCHTGLVTNSGVSHSPLARGSMSYLSNRFINTVQMNCTMCASLSWMRYTKTLLAVTLHAMTTTHPGSLRKG